MKNWIRGATRSATMWFNAVLGSVLTAVPIVQDAFPQLKEYMPDSWYRWGMGALVVGNILLRLKTNSSIPEKGQ